MKPKFSLSLLSILFTIFFFVKPESCFANTDKLEVIITAALDDKNAYTLIESLTTEVGPRMAGTQQEARARKWAQNAFEKMSFDRIVIETFPLTTWERDFDAAKIVSPYPQPLTVTALGGSLSTPAGGVTGEVFRVTNFSELKQLPDNSQKDKIIFVDEVMVRTQDGAGYGAAVQKRRDTAFEAARIGAKAALIRSVGTTHHRFAHTGLMRSYNDKPLPASVPTAALAAPDADQLRRILTKQSNVTLNLEVKAKFKEKMESGNVIAEIKGSDLAHEIVLVGAHLDSWDLGTGAVDDGAGVGIVMAAADLVKRITKKAPRRTIRVVLFGAEEIGLVGAIDYAKRYSKTLGNHIIAAESDFGANEIIKLGTANVAEDRFDAVKRIQSRLASLNILLGDNKAYGGPDLIPLKFQGVPIAGLIQDGLDYFDLHHTANDTFDKIKLDKIQQNVAAYAGFIYLVAYSDVRFR